VHGKQLSFIGPQILMLELTRSEKRSIMVNITIETRVMEPVVACHSTKKGCQNSFDDTQYSRKPCFAYPSANNYGTGMQNAKIYGAVYTWVKMQDPQLPG